MFRFSIFEEEVETGELDENNEPIKEIQTVEKEVEFYLKTFTSNKLIQSYIYYSGLTENAIKFYKEIKKR